MAVEIASRPIWYAADLLFETIASGEKNFIVFEQESHQEVEPSFRYFNQDSAVLKIDEFVRFMKHGL